MRRKRSAESGPDPWGSKASFWSVKGIVRAKGYQQSRRLAMDKITHAAQFIQT
jgi:hypothetical protein